MVLAVDKIIEHEDWQDLNYRDFVAAAWAKARQRGRLPAFETATETVKAVINNGRWVAECPTGDGCAFVVTKSEPYLICVLGPHGPYKVVFPANAAAIEAVLLLRPKPENRNWTTENVTHLRRENRAAGLPDGVTVVV